jgi:transcriptional regulator with XRE-family HTH domain
MKNKNLAISLGVVIRRLRHKSGLSQEEFADLCHLHRTYVSLIERGDRAITVETAQKLAVTLGVSLSELFAEVDVVFKDLTSSISAIPDEEIQTKGSTDEDNIPA